MTTYAIIAALIVGAVALGAMGLLLYGRQSRKAGEATADNRNLKTAVNAARRAGAIDEETSRMSDADLYDELHNGGKQ